MALLDAQQITTQRCYAVGPRTPHISKAFRLFNSWECAGLAGSHLANRRIPLATG